MANNFVGHIDKWLLLSESETDFAALFVRAWIPFNAWYCNNYQSTNDRICLDQVKTDGNQFRAKLIALIDGDFPEAITFKYYLGLLHELLEQHPIPDATVEKRVTLSNICFRQNPKTVTNPIKRVRNLEYKVERFSNSSISAIIVDTRTTPFQTVYNYTHTKYDLIHFEQDMVGSSINNERTRHLKICYEEIDPKKKENMLSNERNNAIKIGQHYFKDDSNLLSQAVIELLYNLRNKLFHGEIQPSRSNLTVYEPSYHLLRILMTIRHLVFTNNFSIFV
jgi:hypothetical protein